jgi:hypothetical protein
MTGLLLTPTQRLLEPPQPSGVAGLYIFQKRKKMRLSGVAVTEPCLYLRSTGVIARQQQQSFRLPGRGPEYNCLHMSLASVVSCGPL